MIQKLNKRNYQLDLARALCVLYIIGIWHFNGYLHESFHYSGNTLVYLHKVTYIVLGTFTFLSGFFCGKYSFAKIADLKDFTKKRFKRFFLLLLFSSTLYFAFRWICFHQLIQIITGTNLFFGDSVPTLWFFSMIIFFYAITPLIKCNFKNDKWNYLIAVLIWIVLLSLSYKQLIDDRLCLYYPFYVGGAFYNRSMIFGKNIKSKISIYLCLIISLVVLVIYTNNVIADYIIILLGIILIIALSYFAYSPQLLPIILFLSEGSMVAYLYHRQIFGIFKLLSKLIYGHIWLNIGVAIIALISTFILSYYFQKIYNVLIQKYYAKQ